MTVRSASGRAHYRWSDRRHTAQRVAEQVKVLFTILAIMAGRALAGLTALGSIYALQVGRKVVGCEARDLAAAASFWR